MRRAVVSIAFSVAVSALLATTAAHGQTPKPFPTPNAPQPTKPATPSPTQPVPAGSPRPADPNTAPSEAMLGLPVFPNAQFLTSFDAGHGQRYYLFGTMGGFAEVVAYYRTVLKTKGELVFDAPAIHMFEVGKFKEESMAFPPGVTVKDYTWGGSQGFLNPKPAAQPARFPTVIQIVPLPEVGQQ